MTFDEFTPKNKFSQTYRHASNPETYTISNYYEYIPTHVRNAENKYKQKFFNKHVRTHNNLLMNMIKLSYRVFKCNKALTTPQNIESHYKRIHFLPKGPLSLNKRETITRNSNLEFKITDLTNFQSLGPEKQAALLDKIFTHVVSTGVFEENSMKSESTLQRSRSLEFLKEIEKSSLQNHFDRFKFALKNIVNTDIEVEFICTWQNVEDAMFQAVGKESKVNRHHLFNKIKPSDFHSKPMEIIFSDIDSTVDASLGKTSQYFRDGNGRVISPYSFSIYPVSYTHLTLPTTPYV